MPSPITAIHVATGDMDVWIAATAENARRVIAAMVHFGFSASSLSESMFCTPGEVIRMGVPPLRIELLTSVSGLEFAEAYAAGRWMSSTALRLV